MCAVCACWTSWRARSLFCQLLEPGAQQVADLFRVHLQRRQRRVQLGRDLPGHRLDHGRMPAAQHPRLHVVDEPAQLDQLDRRTQHLDQLIVLPRLRQIAQYLALIDRVDRGLQVRVGRHDDAHDVGLDLAGAPADLDPGHRRHALVADQDRNVLAFQQIDGFGPIARGQDRELVLEHVPKREQVLRLVVDVQDGICAVFIRHSRSHLARTGQLRENHDSILERPCE